MFASAPFEEMALIKTVLDVVISLAVTNLLVTIYPFGPLITVKVWSFPVLVGENLSTRVHFVTIPELVTDS